MEFHSWRSEGLVKPLPLKSCPFNEMEGAPRNKQKRGMSPLVPVSFFLEQKG